MARPPHDKTPDQRRPNALRRAHPEAPFAHRLLAAAEAVDGAFHFTLVAPEIVALAAAILAGCVAPAGPTPPVIDVTNSRRALP